MAVVLSPWRVIKRQLEEEGALNKMYDPSLTGKVSEIDTASLGIVKVEKFSVTTGSDGSASVTLSKTPDTSQPIVAISPKAHVAITSVSGSTVNMYVYQHLHSHRWLGGGTLAGESATSNFYWELKDGMGNTITDGSGNALYFLTQNNPSSSVGSANTDTVDLSVGTVTLDVYVVYVPAS